MKNLTWLYPGMRIKRWITMSVLGAMLVGAGIILVSKGKPFALGVPLLIFGTIFVIFGFYKTMDSIINVLIPEKQNNVAELIYQRQHLKKGPKIVVIGGGTGLSVLLRGLKKYTSNITAIVTVADDGGSSGKLRGEFGILPPGDIRNCLVALADKETLMEDLFQHRFTNGEGLAGHNMGNLLITALTQIAGDFETAIKEMSKVLAIRGQVLPATLKHCVLKAEMDDGTIIEGESEIPLTRKKIKRVFLSPSDCEPVSDAAKAILEADMVVLGPGSLYTSVIPNLLIKGLAELLSASPAIKVYACNIMTQPGETDKYTASDHIRAIKQHAGSGLIDYAVVNVGNIPTKLLRKYKNDGAEPVKADIKHIEALNVKAVPKDLVYETDVVRHDPEKLAEAIIEMAGEFKGKNDKLFHSFVSWNKNRVKEM